MRTTAATIGGLLPLWFSCGPMRELIAVAIIFGPHLASALTLEVLPVLYSVLFRVNFSAYRLGPV